MTETKPSARDLPPYLGLGVLDIASILEAEGKVTANYLYGSEVLYQVILQDGGCRIIEYLNQKELGQTLGATLRDAFLRQVMAFPPYRHRRFETLYHQLVDQRNIDVRFARQTLSACYPAGYLFALRQPIVAGNRAAWEALKDRLTQQGNPGLLQYKGEHQAVIFRLDASKYVRTEEIVLAVYTTELRNVVAATNLCYEAGIVPVEKEYRLQVYDMSEAMPGSLPVYLGAKGSDVLTYAVFDREGVGVTMEQATEQFKSTSKQLLVSLR
jgi:hypothetical protein